MPDIEDQQKTVELTRMFNAPRELVFSMFTDEQHISKWWGPRGFTNPNTKLEVSVGGAIWLDMKGPDGVVIRNRGEFLEIDKPSKLVFVLRALEDDEGVPQLETHNTFIFSEDEGKTTIRMKAVVTKSNVNTVEAVNGMNEGWSQSLDKLDSTVKAAVRV